jgi:DNA-binding SARP family transcriptional activator
MADVIANPSLRTPWRLSLLGAWQLTGADRPVEVGPNGQRLFALLAIRGPCDRSYVAGTLWPDCSDPRAKGNLRATLSRLHRRRLAEVLHFANGALSLRMDVDVDVRALLATASGILAGTLHAPCRSLLPALTGNALLLGWYEDWVLHERERLQSMCLRALELLASRTLAEGDAPAAVEAALAAVAMDPLRESAHRAVIRGHLAEGNPTEAQRQLCRLRGLLRDEFGAAPSPLTTGLFADRAVAR